MSKDDAVLLLLVGVHKIATQAGIQVAEGGVEMVKLLQPLQAISEAMKLGASFSQAVRLNDTVFQGAVSTVIGAGGAKRVGTTLAVTTATMAFGGFGAVIGIADAIYSWSTENPNRASAEELLPKLEENLKALKTMKAKFLELQEL